MIYSKKVNLILLGVFILFLAVCTYKIVDVNRKYPPADIVTNDENNSIMWGGCKVTALEKKIYTVEEFIKAYPDNTMYNYLTNGESDTTDNGIVVYKVKVKNTTDKKIYFNMPTIVQAEAYPSYWNNGTPLMSGKLNLEPGEEGEYMVNAFYAPSLVHGKKVKNMRNNQYALVFSYYPEKIVLTFN